MAVGFRASSTSSANSGFSPVSSQGMTLAAAIATGDLVVVAVAVATSGSATTLSLSGGSPQGGSWTQQLLVTGGSSGFGTGVNLAVFTGTATASTGGATVTATAGVTGQMLSAAAAYTGATVDIAGHNQNTGSSGVTTLTEPTVTTTASSDWLVDILAIWTASTASPSITNPADAATSRVTTGPPDFDFLGISDSNAGVAQGSQGGGSWSWAGNAAPAGVLLAIKPSSGAHSGTATLSGSGTLTAMGALAGAVTLAGTGTLSWSGSRILKATVLSGSGTLSGTRIGTISETVTLDGEGTLTPSGTVALLQSGVLSGSGSLSVPGFVLKPSFTLTGSGTLSIIGTGGTVQASAGTSNPYAWPGTSQVAVAAPGSTTWQYLGTLGLVTSLTYSFVCPGGADKLSATVMIPASYRTQLLNPGWQVRVTRGGHIVWTGRMDEPVPSAAGWQVTAVGDGQRGQDFRAYYTSTWPSGLPDQAVNNAISRGLPWVNPGIGSPSGIWLGQEQDPASMTVTDLLNLVCTRGGLTWYVNSQPGGQPGSDLSVFTLPTTVTRLLVVTDPVARTLGGDINTIYIRYQITDASSSTSGSQQATYGTTTVQNTASVAAHDVTETYVDLTSAGVMSAGAAQAVGNHVLAIYQRASFAGPFTAAYGQLLSTGGTPVDPGADQAGTVVRLILTDYGYGGEVNPGTPISFIVGAYEWDDFAQKATITPYQSLDESLSGLLSMESTVLTPITTQQ